MVPQSKAHESPRFLTYRGAAEYTSLSVRTIAEFVAKGKLRPARVGRRVLIDVRDLDRLLDECKS